MSLHVRGYYHLTHLDRESSTKISTLIICIGGVDLVQIVSARLFKILNLKSRLWAVALFEKRSWGCKSKGEKWVNERVKQGREKKHKLGHYPRGHSFKNIKLSIPRSWVASSREDVWAHSFSNSFAGGEKRGVIRFSLCLWFTKVGYLSQTSELHY